MKTPQRSFFRTFVVTFVLVCSTCLWLNLRVRITQEGGSSFMPSGFPWYPTRLKRIVGWPKPVLTRTNWATLEQGEIVFDEAMRPHESIIEVRGITQNIIVALTLSATACLLVSAIRRRQFTLRSFLALAFCVAVLIMLVGPYVQWQLEEYKRTCERASLSYRAIQSFLDYASITRRSLY